MKGVIFVINQCFDYRLDVLDETIPHYPDNVDLVLLQTLGIILIGYPLTYFLIYGLLILVFGRLSCILDDLTDSLFLFLLFLLLPNPSADLPLAFT